MLIPAAVIMFLWIAWLTIWSMRKIKQKRRKLQNRRDMQAFVRKANEIFSLAEHNDRYMFIHRGLPGYCVMLVHSDFQARLAQRGKSVVGKPEFEKIERTLEWWVQRDTYMMAFAGSDVLSFHKGHLDLLEDAGDFMAATRELGHVTTTLKALESFYDYLGLPSALAEARKPKFEKVRSPEPPSLPPRESRDYQITPENKLAHIVEYVADGDTRTFDDMFWGDFDHEFVMWIDHRESDDDIVKMCERVLKTGALDAWFDDETLDLIVEYRGNLHRIEYPNDFADRDTSILGLSKIIRPEFEMRYCKASDGSDMVAILPLMPEEWHMLEARCGDKLHNYFEPIDDGFSKFGS